MLKSFIKRLKDSKRLSQFLVLISFLITFAIVRIITHLQKLNILPNQGNDILHIHHLVPGIILLLISGYIGISFWSVHKLRTLMAVLFGIGAALTLDEFALWLFLSNVYWAKQGRDSIDAVVIAIIFLTLAFVLSELADHQFIKRLFRRNRF
jgi:hypothetical protein